MKSVILIPTHPPKFSYAKRALETFKQFVTNGDLYFILSSENELTEFKNFVNQDFNSIVVEGSYHNMITHKKLYGVNYLVTNGYDYVGIVDSEIEFVKDMDLNEINIVYDSKTIKTNTTRDGGRLIKKCADIMGYTDEVHNKTLGYSEYFGFNEICVYEKRSFLEFYNFLKNHKNYDVIMGDTEYFDVFLWNIWLLTNKNFNTINVLPNRKFVFGAIDHNFHDNSISEAFNSILDCNKNHVNIPTLKILFNVDRGLSEGLYLSRYHECV